MGRRPFGERVQQEVDERPDLEATLEHFGTEVRSSRTRQMVSCPVHAEDDPSCSIDLDKQLWRCHSCGAGGDVWSLIEQKMEVTHQRARELAAELGLPTRGAEPGGGDIRQGSSNGRYGREVPARPGGRGDDRPYRPSWRSR